MLKCLLFYFWNWLKALNVAYGNLFSNQWAFTILETDVFKYNIYIISQNHAVYFVEICTVNVK